MHKPCTIDRGFDEALKKVFVGSLGPGDTIVDRNGISHIVDPYTTTFNTGIADCNGTEIFVGDILSKASGKDEREYLVLADEDYFFMTLKPRGSIEDVDEPKFEQFELTKRRARFYEIVSNIYHIFPEED